MLYKTMLNRHLKLVNKLIIKEKIAILILLKYKGGYFLWKKIKKLIVQ